MQSLRQALEAGNPGKVTQMYYVRLPTEEAHHMHVPSNKRSNGVFPAYPPRDYYKDSRACSNWLY